MIKAVVFDLDDTLILEKDFIISGTRAVAQKISADFDFDEPDVIGHMLRLYQDSSLNVFDRFMAERNIEVSHSYIHELVALYRTHDPEIDLLEDSKKVVSLLKKAGYKLGIITDGYKETQNRKIAKLGLDRIFDCIIVTDELGRDFWKPHEKTYMLMKKTLDVEYSQVVYVGDNPKKDFIAAKRLGMTTICIKRENGLYRFNEFDKQYEADYSIYDLEGLFDLVQMPL